MEPAASSPGSGIVPLMAASPVASSPGHRRVPLMAPAMSSRRASRSLQRRVTASCPGVSRRPSSSPVRKEELNYSPPPPSCNPAITSLVALKGGSFGTGIANSTKPAAAAAIASSDTGEMEGSSLEKGSSSSPRRFTTDGDLSTSGLAKKGSFSSNSVGMVEGIR